MIFNAPAHLHLQRETKLCTPFEMGFLAVSVLSSFKFLPNLIKHQGFFMEMASKFLLHSSDISEKLLQNRVE